MSPFSLNPLSALDLLLNSQLSYVFLPEQVELINGMAIIRYLDKPIQIFICQITKDALSSIQEKMGHLKMVPIPIEQFETTINNTLDVFKTTTHHQKEKEQAKDHQTRGRHSNNWISLNYVTLIRDSIPRSFLPTEFTWSEEWHSSMIS